MPFLSLLKFDDEQKQNQPRNTEKMKSKTEVDANGKNSLEFMEPALDKQEVVLYCPFVTIRHTSILI